MAGDPSEVSELRRRISALEEQVAGLADQLQTRRVVVTDGQGRERVVIGVDGEVAEVRLRVPGRSPITEVVLFAASGDGDLAAGVGMQLWRDGDVVGEIDGWADERRSSS